MVETAEDEWNKVISINLSSVFHCIRYQIPAMIQNGGGVIVNASSVCGMKPLPGICPYVAAKHGVVGLTRSAALEYGAQGIRCIAVGPGYIETPMTESDKGGVIDDESKKLLLSRTPQGRYGQPEDVAKAVRMLCSDDACYVNGAYLPVDGGMLVA